MTGQPKRIEREIRALGAKSVRVIQLVVFQALTSGTPVDTGFARASLTPAVGAPVPGELERPSDDEAARKAATSRFSENKARAAAIASTYGLEDGRVFLTYRAGYVVWLNLGSSSQAPKNFVERGIAATLRSPAVRSLGSA